MGRPSRGTGTDERDSGEESRRSVTWRIRAWTIKHSDLTNRQSILTRNAGSSAEGVNGRKRQGLRTFQRPGPPERVILYPLYKLSRIDSDRLDSDLLEIRR